MSRRHTSLMYKLSSGEYLHLSEVKTFSSTQFTDADGLISTLTECVDYPALFVRLETSVGVISLIDHFNMLSAGVDVNGYTAYNDISNDQKVERKILNAWAEIVYPEHTMEKRDDR